MTKNCLRDPIPEIFDAARNLDAAVSAHLNRNFKLAADLIVCADMPIIAKWTESIWGKSSVYVVVQMHDLARPVLPKGERIPLRMPSITERVVLHRRDGFNCRFCGIPVIRREVREAIRKAYPQALKWGKTNNSQHAAFQAMWVQYDHVIPHTRGGDNAAENVVVTCGPCNFGRMNYLVEEIGLIDPRERGVAMSAWDGLERFLTLQ